MPGDEVKVSFFMKPFGGLPITAYAYGAIVIAAYITYSVLALTRTIYSELVGISEAIAPIIDLKDVGILLGYFAFFSAILVRTLRWE